MVTILDGAVANRKVCVVDDLVRSGGTLLECAKALYDHGANEVSFFVVHAEFPNNSWKKFLAPNCPVKVGTFWVCDTVPDVAAKLQNQAPFRIVHIAEDVKNFLDILQ